MKMRWKLLNQDAKRGTQKKKEGANTHTNTPSPERADPEKARKKKKADGRRIKKPTREGGADGSAWHNLQGESQSQPRNAKDPNLT